MREYLANRGIDEATIEKFEIGWNGPGDELLRFLQAKGYNEQDMVAANVVRLNESGLHDVFVSRITFPIHDPLGNPIGFTARSMIPKRRATYQHDRDRRLRQRSYGLQLSLRQTAPLPARKGGWVYARVSRMCDGFFLAGYGQRRGDAGHGVHHEQLRLLRQCSLHLTFCYDGDKAGQNATYKAAKLAWARPALRSASSAIRPDWIRMKFCASTVRKNFEQWSAKS